MTGQQDAAQVARELTAALDKMSQRLEAVGKDSKRRTDVLTVYGKRNRHLIVTTLVSVALDIMLTVVIAVVAVAAHNASVAARYASASNYALCQSGNTARHEQIALWDFVLALPPTQHHTAQQAHNITTFKAYLQKIYAPRDCAALGRRH